MKEAGDVPQKAGPDFLSDAQRPSFGGFLLDCIRLEILSKSDIRILDLTFIFVLYIKIQYVEFTYKWGNYINTSIGASSEKKGVKITLIVKRHLTFVFYLNLVTDD